MLPGETASPNTLVFPTKNGMGRHASFQKQMFSIRPALPPYSICNKEVTSQTHIFGTLTIGKEKDRQWPSFVGQDLW
jgi:hypothetical protein